MCFHQFNFLLALVLKINYDMIMIHVNISNVSVFGKRNRIASGQCVDIVWTGATLGCWHQ